MVIKRKEIETIERRNSTAHTSPNWAQKVRPDLNGAGKSVIKYNLESQPGKGPRQCVYPVDETSNSSLTGFLLIIPLSKRISSSVCLQKCSSGFTLAFLHYGLFHFVSHRVSLDPGGLARPSGAQEIPGPTPFLTQGPRDWLCLRAATASGQYPGGSGADQRPGLLLLKPEKDFPPF